MKEYLLNFNAMEPSCYVYTRIPTPVDEGFTEIKLCYASYLKYFKHGKTRILLIYFTGLKIVHLQ